MLKTPEIHAEYDPVLRIKSYAKNTRNFYELVLGLVELIDAKGIDMAQPIRP